MATGWQVPRVAQLADQFDPRHVSPRAEDVLELHNVQQYLEHGFLPSAYSEEQRDHAKAQIPRIHSAVARFFTAIDDENFAAVVSEVRHEYHGDLLDLLGRYGAFERCGSETVLPSLAAAGVRQAALLANKKLVRAYDEQVRDELRASPRGAEHLIRKYLQEDVRGEIHLPPSFTPTDSRELLEAYIDSEDANSNYIRLIASAKENPGVGIDSKLKLRAKRRNEKISASVFAKNKGYRTGCEVGISTTQYLPVVFGIDDSSDGLICRYTYSSRWLEETLDSPSILNNFQHLFEFADSQTLLSLPSYPADMGVMERIMGTTGKTEYKVGAAAQAADWSSLLQTHMYLNFLEKKDLDLEQVISWFFEKYLYDEFEVANFSFTASDRGTSYLQKVRHIFAEMESVATQFTLFVGDGELDRDLLAMGSEQVRYKAIPSLLEGKYVYPSEGKEITGILNLLFSDQSSLNYISETLNADNAARLLLDNWVGYSDFEDYQTPGIDYLIALGVLEDTGTRVQFVNIEQFHILNALFTRQAASYYHLSEAGRKEADAIVARGWATRRSSLLTDAEGKYFNYFLNGLEFSNGPQLRNKYLHGVQTNSAGEDTHFNTYLIALRLTIALIIKINDDLCLFSAEVRPESRS